MALARGADALGSGRLTAALTTTSIIGVLIAGAILYLVRRDHLHGSYALWWLAVAGAALLLSVFPQVIDWLGRATGIAYAPVLPIIVAIGMILLRMLKMDIDRSRSERQLRRLTQKIGILEQELSAAKRGATSEAATARPKTAQVIPLPKSGDA
jgi:hypothetical protein